MKATRCDRCGNYFDIDYKAPSELRTYTTLGIQPKAQYDLCPECMKKLTKWLNKYKDKDITKDSSNLTADVCEKITTSVIKDIESGKGLQPIGLHTTGIYRG